MTARDRLVLLVAALVALGAASYYFVLSPRRAEVRSLSAQVSSAEVSLQGARVSAAAAAAAKRSYVEDYGALARLGKAVPSDDDLPGLLVQLQDIAHRSHVRLASLQRTQGGASSGTSASAPATGTATTPSTTSTTTATTGTTTATTTAPPATGAAAPSGGSDLPPGVSVGASGLGVLPLEVRFTGRYLDLQRLVVRMQSLTRREGDGFVVHGRLLTLDGFTLDPAESGSKLDATMQMTAYVLPEGQSPMGPDSVQSLEATGTSALGTTPDLAGSAR